MVTLKRLFGMVPVLSILLGLAFQGAVKAETVGKSIAVVNGEAIFLSEFQSNYDSLMEQRKRMPPDQQAQIDWAKDTKKALLDQMVDEKLLLQEAKKRDMKVPKRQIEEGILQVKNRFKEIPQGKKPTKEDYERPLTEKENAEFLKELKAQNLSEKEFEAKIEDQLRVLRLTEEEVRLKIPEPFVHTKDEGEKEEPVLTSDYDKEARALYDQLEKKFNDPNFKADPTNDLDIMVSTLKPRYGEQVRASHILIKSSRTDDMK